MFIISRIVLEELNTLQISQDLLRSGLPSDGETSEDIALTRLQQIRGRERDRLALTTPCRTINTLARLLKVHSTNCELGQRRERRL